jgi:hypothetical protein
VLLIDGIFEVRISKDVREEDKIYTNTFSPRLPHKIKKTDHLIPLFSTGNIFTAFDATDITIL